jgi:hypothetical protein
MFCLLASIDVNEYDEAVFIVFCFIINRHQVIYCFYSFITNRHLSFSLICYYGSFIVCIKIEKNLKYFYFEVL